MSREEVVRAWKDQRYRRSLSAGGVSDIPPHPSGIVEIDIDDLDDDSGGTTSLPCIAFGTAMLSCYFACSQTIWDGSCGAMSYGCCGTGSGGSSVGGEFCA